MSSLKPLLAAAALLAGVVPGTAGATRVASWSAPATLSACPASGAARAVFPSNSPDHATGPGAVAWTASPACPGGEGARVARIGAGGVPGPAMIPRTPDGRRIAPTGSLEMSGGPHGQIVLAGSAPASPGPDLLIQGAGGGPFSPLGTLERCIAPIALATGYLGDVALACATGERGSQGPLRLNVERYFARTFSRDMRVSSGGGHSAQSLTVTLDYRSDALVVWEQDRSIYARDLPASGAAHPIERLAATGPHVRITALLSDDNRAIVAWVDDRGGEARVYLDRSATGVRFGAPTLLERFADPERLPSPAASPRLIRLSSESVMMAWAGSENGRWVVRTAAIDLQGVRAVNTIAAPAGDALLADLAPGPVGDAVALWTEPQQSANGQPDLQRQAIFAARGFDAYPGRTVFGAAEQVATPAAVGDATVALDPASDRALALWRGEGARVEYAIRTGPSGP